MDHECNASSNEFINKLKQYQMYNVIMKIHCTTTSKSYQM